MIPSGPGRHKPHHRDPANLALNPKLGEWWRRLDEATHLLDTTDANRDAAVDCLLNLTQKYVACPRRGTHAKLSDCWSCTSDYLRGDATLAELLAPDLDDGDSTPHH